MPDENVTTPDGTEENPYLVHTWAELVDFSTSGAYVKVANDIDVLAEYPDGDAPTLTLGAYIDGDNKTISRWYCAGSRYLINSNNTNTYYIKNCIFTNIKTGYHLASIHVQSSSDTHPLIKNCKFAGIMGDGYIFTPNDNRSYNAGMIQDVVINIRGANVKLFYIGSGSEYHYYNLNVELTSSTDTLLFSYYSSRHVTFHDSQFVLHTPNLARTISQDSYCSFDNSILDIYHETNNISFSGENSAVSIFNKTHAPETTGIDNKVVPILDADWHNPTALAEAGFNIAVGD